MKLELKMSELLLGFEHLVTRMLWVSSLRGILLIATMEPAPAFTHRACGSPTGFSAGFSGGCGWVGRERGGERERERQTQSLISASVVPQRGPRRTTKKTTATVQENQGDLERPYSHEYHPSPARIPPSLQDPSLSS